MMLQCEFGANALHEPGSAAPKLVHTPLPPATIEHWLFCANVEQFFAISGRLNFVEQKLRFGEPGLNTEQSAGAAFGSGWNVLHWPWPRPFVEQRRLFCAAKAEHWCGCCSANVLHCEGAPPACVGGSTEHARFSMATEQPPGSGPNVEHRLPLLLSAEQWMPGTSTEQKPAKSCVEQTSPGCGPGGITEVPRPTVTGASAGATGSGMPTGEER